MDNLETPDDLYSISHYPKQDFNVLSTENKAGKIHKDKSLSILNDKWHGFKPTEMTPEIQREMQIHSLQKFMNPKNFYKGIDHKKLPKYFQIGEVIGDEKFQKTSNNTRRSKGNLIDHILDEDSKLNFSRKKFQEIREKRPIKHKTSKKLQKIKKLGKKMIKRG